MVWPHNIEVPIGMSPKGMAKFYVDVWETLIDLERRRGGRHCFDCHKTIGYDDGIILIDKAGFLFYCNECANYRSQIGTLWKNVFVNEM